MIELHDGPTPNGYRITPMPEQAGLPHAFKPMNIGRGLHFTPGPLAIAPNDRMAAIVDTARVAADAPRAAPPLAQSAKLLRSSSPTSSPRPLSTALAAYSAVCST